MKINWQNFPIKPSRFPFFYGWFLLPFCSIGIVMSIPGQTMGFGPFKESIVAALSISDLNLTYAYGIGTGISALILPFAGRLLDKIGTRTMMVISSLGLSLSIILLSNCDRIISASNLNSIRFTIAFMAIFILLIRFFGQGCMTMTSRVVIGRWFNHKRGLAAGISTIFVTFGFNGSPWLLSRMIANHGWRNSYHILAVVIGLGMALLAFIIFRDNPEQCGLSMDGGYTPPAKTKNNKPINTLTHEFTRSQALKTLGFWTLACTTGFQSLIATAIGFHMRLIGQEQGLTSEQAWKSFAFLTLFSVPCAFISSALSDRIKIKYIFIAFSAFQCLALLSLTSISTKLGMFTYLATMGIAAGMFGPLLNYVPPRFFGRKHLGAISGISTSILVLSSALAPFIFSKARSITGSFEMIIIILAIIPALMIIMGIKTTNPQDKYITQN